LKEAEEALKSDDKATIDAKSQALATAAHKLAEQMLCEREAAQQSASGGGEAKADGAPRSGEDGEVVDCRVRGVKDKK